VYFNEHKLREVLILDEATNIVVKDKKIVGWKIRAEE